WQFESVMVLLIPLVLFCKDLLKPVCLFFGSLLVCRGGLVSYDELLPTTITPQGAHLLKTRRLFPALALLYCYCLHEWDSDFGFVEPLSRSFALVPWLLPAMPSNAGVYPPGVQERREGLAPGALSLQRAS